MKNFVSLLFVVVLGGLFNCGVSAQKGLKYSSVRRVYVEQPDKKIEAYVSIDKKLRPSPELIYHWYDNNIIHQTQGGYSNYLLDGIYTEFYFPSNGLCSKGRFKKGLKQGKWCSWSRDGKLEQTVHWRGGVINGKICNYNALGVLEKVEKYSEGVLNGRTVYLDSSNNVVVAFYKDGVLKSEKTRKKGELSFPLIDKIKKIFEKKGKRKGEQNSIIQKE